MDGLYEYERSSDELLRQVKKKTEVANEGSILRKEVLDDLYEYDR